MPAMQSSVNQNAQDVVRVRRVDDPAPAAFLFRRKFGHPTPDFPAHYLATQGAGAEGRVVGYVHMTAMEDFRLAGGLCVDETAYRAMDAGSRAIVRAAGGIARLLMAAATRDHGDAAASFAYIGNPQSRKICRDVGYELVAPPYLHAHWHDAAMSAQRRAAIVERVRALGAF
jgi:hypothetical protein